MAATKRTQETDSEQSRRFTLRFAFLRFFQCASRRRAAARPQAPIYEEMAGVKPSRQRLNPGLLDHKDDSEYKNCPSKKSCPENHYETPRRRSEE